MNTSNTNDSLNSVARAAKQPGLDDEAGRRVTLSQACRSLRSIIRRLGEDNQPVIITRQARPEGVLLSWTEYSSLVETACLLGFPANAAHLHRSLEKLQAGEVMRSSSEPLGQEAETWPPGRRP